MQDRKHAAATGQQPARLRLPYLPGGHTRTRYVAERTKCVDGPVLSRIGSRIAPEKLPAFVVASCSALLYRYSGQDRFVLRICNGGTRPSPGCHDVTIGTAGSMRFDELRRNCGAAIDEACEVAASKAQVAITLSPRNRRSIRAFAADGQTEVVLDAADLDFRMLDKAGRLQAELVYNGNHFAAGMAQQLLRHLVSLMDHAATDHASRAGSVTVDRLALFSPADREWLNRQCNGPQRVQSVQAVHRDIERRAAQNPDRVAVRFANQALSYRQLNERANALAHYMTSQATLANSRIVVCVEPSPDTVVSLLAILKAGAAYVPLNPTHPELRLHAIVADTEPVLALTHEHNRQLLSSTGVRIVSLDRESAVIAQCSTANLRSAPAPGDNATVYYTSGTTGQPKGVMASHANLRHIIDVTQRQYGFRDTDIMPAIAACTFSISIFELLSPLVAGGTLLLLERAHVLDPERMAETLNSVTFAHIGPSLLRNIVRHIRASNTSSDDFAGLRHLSSGGDMIPPQLLSEMQGIFRNAELYVIYGCSEISLMGCTCRVHQHQRVERTYVGRPFPNVGMTILDDDGNAVPAGAIGDVCFSGLGVTVGYLNRPALTDQQYFVRDGRRWYRTGDRGRLNEDGLLELLGRRDFQVQLHGMRIELAEIEHHLLQVPGVRSGVVTQVHLSEDRPALVGWYVRESSSSITEDDLRSNLHDRLPDYMVPGFFRQLDTMPLNHNLKIDRAALPAFTNTRPRTIVEPLTASEKMLSDIWCRVLNLPYIGRDDNFLLLGGDSLLAMEMILLVRKEMSVTLDGMDILRESLQVLGGICDRQLAAGHAPTALRVPDPVRHRVPVTESFFFGDDESLYGVYHPPVGGGSDKALLICPALGPEYSRTHFLLKTLAGRLADSGFAVLRFDYFGTADSLGNSEDASPSRWLSDIVAAYRELVRRSGVVRPSVLGVRAGANFALQALDRENIGRKVLWDPVVDGDEHVRRLSAMHSRRVRRLIYMRRFRRPTFAARGRELLGTTYSDLTIEGLRKLRLDPGLLERPAVSCLLSPDLHDTPVDNTLADKLDVPCNWYDVSQMGTAIGIHGIVRRLEESIGGHAA